MHQQLIRISLLFFAFAAAFWLWKGRVSAETAHVARIEPHADAPQCKEHNPNEWHGLWNYEQGCHYNHEHKDNPGILTPGMPEAEREQAERMIEVFGAPGAWFGGTSISYPWQTFHGAMPDYTYPDADTPMENSMKHEGYGWIVRHNLPKRGGQYVSDFRMQYHAIFAAPGAVTRYHSFSLEANICSSKGECRIIRTGGWADFGHLRITGNRVDLPHQEGDGNRQRLHTHHRYPEFAVEESYTAASVWYGQFIHPEFIKNNFKESDADRPFRTLTIALETNDTWSNAHHKDPYTNDFFCPEFDCNKNGSAVKLHRIRFDVAETGFAGYTDRFGRTNHECTAISLDCIPTSITEGFKLNTHYNDKNKPRDYDLSPEGVWWIRYPN